MKGGITSGIVYPPAVLELASRYRFRCIGGTSAGAIAAVITAAAEYDREGGGFERLEKLSKWLCSGTNLFDLFQPTRKSRPLMETLLAFNAAVAKGRRVRGRSANRPPVGVGGVITAVRKGAGLSFWIWALLGATAGLLFGTVFVRGLAPDRSLSDPWVVSVAVIFFAMPGGILAALGGSLWRLSTIARKELPSSFYGLCTGRTVTVGPGQAKGLTDWLHEQICDLAGVPTDSPLTVGQLERKSPGSDGKPRDILLRTISTNLSHAQPYVLPFDRELFLFAEADMARLFPESVVSHLKAKARTSSRLALDAEGLKGFHILPRPSDIPVVMLARMSLSFPVLLSAVPLYAIRRDAYQRRKDGDRVVLKSITEDLQPCWFSDGGISSNFPIHFFDAWFPTRPTFGINLSNLPEEDFEVDAKAPASPDARQRLKPSKQAMVCQKQLDEEETDVAQAQQLAEENPDLDEEGISDPDSDDAVFLPKANRPIYPPWTAVEGLGGFLGAIWATAQNYRDSTQTRLPSYRERIVQVRFAPDEGGLNLAMGDTAIESIVRKGAKAGELLRKSFNFDHHRWVRFRVLMAQLEQELAKISKSYPDRQALETFLRATDVPRPYSRDDEWSKEAMARVDALLELLQRWRALHSDWQLRRPKWKDPTLFVKNGPQPEPVLRVTPR